MKKTLKKNYTQTALQNTLVVFFGIMLSSVIGYVIRIVLARNLSLAEFGVIYVGISLVMLVFVLTNFGQTNVLVRFIPKFLVQKKYSAVKSTVFYAGLIQTSIGVVAAVLLYAFSGLLAEHYFKTPIAQPVIQLFSLLFIFLAIEETLRNSFRGFQKMSSYALLDLTKNLLYLGLILLMLFSEKGYKGVALAFVLSSPAVTLIFIPLLLRSFNFFKYKLITKGILKECLSFGILTMLTSVTAKIVGYIDILIVTFFLSVEHAGVYEIAFSTAVLLLMIPRIINIVMMPMFSEIWSKGEKSKIQDGLSRLHKYVLVIAIPVLLVLFVFSDLIISLLFGQAYVAGTTALRILLFGMFFYIMVRVNNGLLIGVGMPKIVFIILSVTAGTNILLDIILTPRFGINGAATGTLCSTVIGFILSTFLIKKIIKSSFPWKQLLKTVSIGLVFAGIMLVSMTLLDTGPIAEAVIAIAIASVAYAVLITKLKIVTPNEIKTLIRNLTTNNLINTNKPHKN